MVAARILRAFGTGKGEIVVLNDEAHHCYQDKLLEHPDDDADKEDKERNRDARVWFRGLLRPAAQGRHQGRLRPLGDAVLPEGLGLQRGLHLPLGGQRLLADGRDRVGDREDPAHPGRRRRRRRRSSSTCDLWDNIQPPLPKQRVSQGRSTPDGSAGCRPRRSRARCAASTAATTATTLGYEDSARRARRAAAGDDRRLPEHGRLEARVRLDRRPGGRAARRHDAVSPPGNLAAAQQRRGRRLGHAAAHDPRRLRAARVRRAAGRRLQARTRRARSRRSSRPTACATPAPTSTSSPMPTCCARR